MRRLASEVIRELENRIARLEHQARIKFDPNPAPVEFHVQEGRGFARFYVGGKLTHLVTKAPRPIEEHFKKCFIKSFCKKNYLHDITQPLYVYADLYETFAGVMDEVDFFEVLTRVRMGELALQINCDRDQEWLRKISAEIKEIDKGDPNYFYDMDLDYWVSDPSMVEGFTVDGVCDKALKETISHFTSKYGQKKFDPSTYRLASTNKVAGHLVLATGVNVFQLQEALEDTVGVEDIEMDDGVLTFLMDKFENKNIEKQIKALARKYKVKFEKGEMTDGLGMIHTSSRRMASRRKNEPAIETSTKSVLDTAWPNVSYKGKGDFLDTYLKWIKEIEDQEIGAGLETDKYDRFGNSLEVTSAQEVYLGYHQDKDYFVMGFDLGLYSPESADAWVSHQEALDQYQEAMEEWDGDDELDVPEESDFVGYDFDYEGESDPSEGVSGWAAVTFRAAGNRVEVIGVEISASDEIFYRQGFNEVKRKHRDIIDLRLD